MINNLTIRNWLYKPTDITFMSFFLTRKTLSTNSDIINALDYLKRKQIGIEEDDILSVYLTHLNDLFFDKSILDGILDGV